MVLVALIGTVLTLLVRSVRPEAAFPVGIISAGTILVLALNRADGLIGSIRQISDYYGVSDAYLTALLKMTGIAYLTRFGANLCRDFGQSATAGKLELGGRICILSCAVPAVITLLETGLSLLSGAAS